MKHAITFVHSPTLEFGQNYGTRFAPLWAYTLAAYVPDEFESRLIDCSVEDPSEIEPADVFAFSGINQDLASILAVQRLLEAKYPDARFILGGPITWSFEQEGRLELLGAFDYLFLLDGERTLPLFLDAVAKGTAHELPRIVRVERFDLAQARKVSFELYQKTARPDRYYGAAIEVSRGCPFLCEFCDIRVLPGNNRANNKPVSVVIEEMDRYRALGISQFLFVCDNFIGDPSWARECADAIIAWRAKTGATPSIFCWLTINLARHGALMVQLRRAGFSVLYIGVESVNQNSLLETAKLQNRGDLGAAVKRIHEHGFVVAPGLIFGFDSDTHTVFDDTLAFIEETGLLGGDPSFLSALPGTPLFERMKRTGRLVQDTERAIERRKIATNVRYRQNRDLLSRGFMAFMNELTSPAFQLARFRRHLELIVRSESFVETGGVGFGSPWQYLRLQWASAESRRTFAARVSFALRPAHALAILRALLLWRRAARTRAGLGVHFFFWLYFWTNLALKYRNLAASDFELHDVPTDFNLADIARDAASALLSPDRLSKPRSKAAKQAASTSAALQWLAASNDEPQGMPNTSKG